jgi:hypothetical protein
MNYLLSILIMLVVISIIKYVFIDNNDDYYHDILNDDDDDYDYDYDINHSGDNDKINKNAGCKKNNSDRNRDNSGRGYNRNNSGRGRGGGRGYNRDRGRNNKLNINDNDTDYDTKNSNDTSNDTDYNTNDKCDDVPEKSLADNYLDGFIDEHFKINIEYPSSSETSFKKIKPNKLYYGLACKYVKNDCFYTALKEAKFKLTEDISKACLIVPCSYESTEKEIDDLKTEGISENIYGDGVRIFMLNNTDHMVSKLALWKYLKSKYGEMDASGMIPYTWDLTTSEGVNKFKKDFDKNKLYITKNNRQRQEGITIHNSLQGVLDARDQAILVQELLQDPYLVNGRKINLRVYVLVVRDNYGNVKILIYKDGFMYYTKELFKKNQLSFDYNITTGYVEREIYEQNPLTHMDFRKFLDSKRKLSKTEKYIKKNYPNVKLSSHVFSQIYKLLINIFQTYENTVGTKTDGIGFQLYGTDIAIDEDLNPMIMEINKGPDLTGKDVRDTKLKVNMGKDILKSVGLLENKKNKFLTALEMIHKNGKYTTIYNFSEVK